MCVCVDDLSLYTYKCDALTNVIDESHTYCLSIYTYILNEWFRKPNYHDCSYKDIIQMNLELIQNNSESPGFGMVRRSDVQMRVFGLYTIQLLVVFDSELIPYQI